MQENHFHFDGSLSKTTTFVSKFKQPPISKMSTKGMEVPRIDTSRIISPFLAKYGESTSLTVRIFGKPPPIVKWYVGRKIISNCARYHVKQMGYSYTLDINNVTDEINNGIFVIATNFMGEDSCMLDVKAYRG